MTTLEKFLAADKKVTEIENNGGVWIEGYDGVKTSNEYEAAHEEAQKLYSELQELGIDPWN